ncbi:hypothetical protein Y032_0005g2442 [Ancylostoma ceylanicum]|nr:hypothetical protein Y032_0005g2442 [Ancylostoma ceylanicum]
MVRVNNSYSKPRPAHSGVPQGGVLSPILFNVYTYDLLRGLSQRNVSFCAFADDLKIYHSIGSLDDVVHLQEAVDFVSQWANQWKLPLSSEKTEVLHLGPHNINHVYTISDTSITSVEEVVDLGFLITKNLSFDKHCERVANKAMRIVHNIFRGLITRNSAVLLKAYKAYVRPILEYGTPVFSPFTCKSIKRLERVQNTFTRRLMIRTIGFHYDQIPSSDERNLNLGLSTLSFRRKINDLLLLHKILYGKCGLEPQDLFSLRASNTRGGTIKYRLRKARLNCRRYFFVNRTVFDKIRKNHQIPLGYNTFKKLLEHTLIP